MWYDSAMVIGVWGDSITFGSCDEDALGWVGRLRKTLPHDDDHLLYNFGVCGETSEGLLKRFEIEASAVEPDITMFAIGINDAMLPFASEDPLVPIDAFRRNIETLLKQAARYSHTIAFVGLTKVSDEWRTSYGNRYLHEVIEKYDNEIQRVATQHAVLYVPMSDVIDPHSDLADGLHPNAAGYEKMFERARGILEAELLPKHL